MTTLQNAPGFYSPKVHTVQGANSKTFSRVGLDTTLTLPELFKYHAENSAEHPVFVYMDEEKNEHIVRFPEVYRGIRKAATIASRHYERMADYYSQAQQGKSENDPPIIGILATADSISYYTLEVALMYLGLTPFPISTRNSAIAVAHLVSKTGVRQMFVSSDPAMQRLAQEAIEMLKKDGRELELLPMPTFEDMYGPGGDDELVPMGKVSPDKTCLILHSSGSTAFPKPIRFLDKNFRKWGTFVFFGEFDFCGVRVGAQTNPMFHAMGALMITWTVYTGVVWTMFKPSTPPIVPTPEIFLESVVETRTEVVYCVPAFIEAWARDPANKDKIKTLRAMIYAGAPMNKQIGDHLANEGIALIPFYGSTELGSVVRLIPHPDTMDKPEWDYFQISPHIDVRLIPQEGQPDIFEPVAFDSPTFTPNVFNSIIDGRPAYSTSDLLQRHPTKHNLFRVYGRADDQLMLSTGEKTNPAPLEAILTQDPHVHACLMFGRGRFQNGVLIQPKEPFDPSNEEKLEEFRNKIWPSIEKMNAYAPSHSRVFKEMIMVTSPNKPLEYTAKGTPRRQVCIAAYSEEIDALYKRVEESSQVDLAPPRDWAPETMREYVTSVVRKVMKNNEVKDEDDIFQQGCDSLQATWIRNTLIHTLRVASNVNVHDIPSNFVYAHPSIAALSNFLSGLISGKTVDADAERAAAIDRMRALLEKYSQSLERRFPEKLANGYANGHANGHANGYANGHANGHANGRAAHGQTVLVTGTTGRLGSHILAQLLARDDVDKVYALNRESSGSVKALGARQKAAFEQWGLDASLLDTGKVTLYAVDLAKPNFGLSKEEYEEMRESVTQIIHNAWRVDFQVSLSSFEPLIAGARNLLELALNSSVPGGPRVLFVSSISSLRNYSDSKPAPESIDFEPHLAVGTGYSESKWVTEQLFRRAAEKTGLHTTSVRVGQVSGDQRTGGWNTSEWVATLVRASQRLGCIPVKDEELTWVAVDVVAAALQDMVSGGKGALHLVSPKPVPWNSVFVPIAEELNLPTVPYSEWLEKLEKSAAAASSGPGVGQHDSAHNLLGFFKSEGMGGAAVPLSTEKAVRVSKSLAGVRPIGREDALNYVRFWQKVGYLKA
ncbi:acetyl-CoA synthetase-like protein [Trametes coccinea BRFM310]|uniref:Acetyl-CoA synthetase-like protein n=1 Tax=Trametes coccinea (strain BRFM310) TaxID=1353009 RepID=A0A1Y2IHQ6_TRAC3|nr:acetyl-CoA synthetase-like protein [Trametes coccinea BRFM310]